MENRGMDETTARQRMGMQSPQAAKINQADRVIDNSGTLDELYAQLDEVWAVLKIAYPRRMARLPVLGNVENNARRNASVDKAANDGSEIGSEMSRA
jgi:hypothetical protein